MDYKVLVQEEVDILKHYRGIELVKFLEYDYLEGLLEKGLLVIEYKRPIEVYGITFNTNEYVITFRGLWKLYCYELNASSSSSVI